MAAVFRRIRQTHLGLDRRLRCLVSSSGLLSTFYYGIANRSLDRETKAVLAGRALFEANAGAPQQTSSLLRRNIHRLEKGLIMRPRRDLFALDYIGETVTAYAFVAQARCATEPSDPELIWAHDVLREYFEVTLPHSRTASARELFTSLESPIADRTHLSIPYRRADKTYQIPDYQSLLELAKQRRSVRWFDQRPVPRTLITKALEVATQAPSACNRQPFVFRIFDDPDLIRQVAGLPGGTKGFEHNFPMIAVVVGELRNYYAERDRHLIYIDGGLASMSFILALETLGLSSCCINWPDLSEPEARAKKVLKLAPDQRPVMLIAIGYADPTGMIPFSQKKAPTTLARYNFE